MQTLNGRLSSSCSSILHLMLIAELVAHVASANRHCSSCEGTSTSEHGHHARLLLPSSQAHLPSSSTCMICYRQFTAMVHGCHMPSGTAVTRGIWPTASKRLTAADADLSSPRSIDHSSARCSSAVRCTQGFLRQSEHANPLSAISCITIIIGLADHSQYTLCR